MSELKITAKQERFCQEYVIDCNGTQAAIRAGYAENSANVTASELLTKSNIAERVAELQEEAARVARITAARVLRRLDETAERCMQGEPVVDSDGKPTGEWKFDSNGANRANELLGKHFALFIDRMEHTGANGGAIELRSYDANKATADLAAIIGTETTHADGGGEAEIARMVADGNEQGKDSSERGTASGAAAAETA